MVIYATVMSLGLGTAISGAVYYIYDIVSKKVRSKLYCSVKIKSRDPIFHNINKYMKDKGYVVEGTSLKARVMPHWKRKDKSKEEMEYLPGYGNHII
jgi:hypothetical protein